MQGDCIACDAFFCKQNFYYSLVSVTNGKHEFVPKNVFTEAEKFAKVIYTCNTCSLQ